MTDTTPYTGLITSEHADKPKFVGWVSALVAGNVDIATRLGQYSMLYDLDVAADDRLDTLGLWVGLSRYLPVQISGVYFSWNTTNVGWNQGVWKGPFDPSTGLVRLGDETYRTFLRAKIGANHWDGTLSGWNSVMSYVFAGTGTTITAIDNQDMSMDVLITGTIPSGLTLALIKQGYLQLKPTSVSINNYYVTSVPGAPIFAWNASPGSGFDGWNVGAWATTL